MKFAIKNPFDDILTEIKYYLQLVVILLYAAIDLLDGLKISARTSILSVPLTVRVIPP